MEQAPKNISQGWKERLKIKWGVKRDFDFVIILIVFAITGSTSAYLGKPALSLLGIDSQTAWYVKLPVYLIVITPIYQVLLLAIGAIFGQFTFFLNFEKRTFFRFLNRTKNK